MLKKGGRIEGQIRYIFKVPLVKKMKVQKQMILALSFRTGRTPRKPNFQRNFYTLLNHERLPLGFRRGVPQLFSALCIFRSGW